MNIELPLQPIVEDRSMYRMCGNMYGKEANQQKLLDEIQMNFHINRIPNNGVILYALSIVTQKL